MGGVGGVQWRLQLISEWLAKMGNARMAKRHDVTSSFAACYYVTPIVYCCMVEDWVLCANVFIGKGSCRIEDWVPKGSIELSMSGF